MANSIAKWPKQAGDKLSKNTVFLTRTSRNQKALTAEYAETAEKTI
jgi:hypothetical protein